MNREHFNLALKFLHNNKLDPNSIRIDAGELLLKEELDSARSSYAFNLLEGTTKTQTPGESKLSNTDGFFVTHLALSISKIDSSKTGNATGNSPAYHYPDSNYFKGASGGETEAAALETLFGHGASIKLMTNTTERIKSLPSHWLRVVPERGYLVAGGNQIADEHAQSIDAYCDLLPCHGLSGQSNNTFTLNLAEGPRTLIAGGVNEAGAAVSTRNVVTLHLRGFYLRDIGHILKGLGC